MTAAIPNAQAVVLVVDDDEYSQDLASRTLGTLGFIQIQSARNGNDGLRVMEEMPRPPDLLICDIFMPDQDGIELMGALAERGYQGGVILVSGGDSQMLAMARQIAMESGLKVLGAFTKPLQLDELKQALFAGEQT
jgi:response regulator of citrate/malate metabolism